MVHIKDSMHAWFSCLLQTESLSERGQYCIFVLPWRGLLAWCMQHFSYTLGAPQPLCLDRVKSNIRHLLQSCIQLSTCISAGQVPCHPEAVSVLSEADSWVHGAAGKCVRGG